MYYRWAKMEGEWEIVCFEDKAAADDGYFLTFFGDKTFFASDFEETGFEWGDWVEVPPEYSNRRE